jgi:hypothetical protein
MSGLPYQQPADEIGATASSVLQDGGQRNPTPLEPAIFPCVSFHGNTAGSGLATLCSRMEGCGGEYGMCYEVRNGREL